MTQARPKFATFEECLEFDDGTKSRYELIDGELFALPPELDHVHLDLTQKQRTTLIDALPPQLVAEVFSPGKANRDLIRKRAQYAKRGIPESWLIDSENQSVTVLTLEGDRDVEVGSFQHLDRRVLSRQFPDLQLTLAQFEN